MRDRPKIPPNVTADVLTTSRRRCCLCFGLRQDESEKKGQIAHLDRDPSNHAPDNLAYLCFDHHDQYDSRTSQSKGLTPKEVKHYRTELLQFLTPSKELLEGSNSNENAEQIEPALAVAREADERVAFAEMHREWLTTNAGVDAARSEFVRLCEAMQNGSEARNKEMKKGSIIIRYSRSEKCSCVASARGLSLLMIWHCPYDNTLDDAFLSVEFYPEKSDFTTGIPIYMEKDRLSATEYSLDLELSSELVWRRRDANHKMPTGVLVEFYLTSLLHKIMREQTT